MKTKEAAKILTDHVNGIPSDVWDEDCDKFTEAVNLAVKALRVYRDCKNCIHKFTVNHMYGCDIGICEFEEADDDTVN